VVGCILASGIWLGVAAGLVFLPVKIADHVDLLGRVRVRQIDCRKGVRLGPDGRLVPWKKAG